MYTFLRKKSIFFSNFYRLIQIISVAWNLNRKRNLTALENFLLNFTVLTGLNVIEK